MSITITMEQVDYLYDLLQRTQKAIEARRAAETEDEENDQGKLGQKRR
jgi:hypothetical protein